MQNLPPKCSPPKTGHLCRLAAYWLQPPGTELFGSQRRQRRGRRHGGCPCDQGGEGSNFGIEILPGYVGAKRGFDEISKQGAMNGAISPGFRSKHILGRVYDMYDVFTFMVFFGLGVDVVYTIPETYHFLPLKKWEATTYLKGRPSRNCRPLIANWTVKRQTSRSLPQKNLTQVIQKVTLCIPQDLGLDT